MPSRLDELEPLEQAIYSILLVQSRKPRTAALIDYGTLGLAVKWPADQLGRPLGNLVRWCREHDLGALSALVVQRDTRIPGTNYYPVAHNVRLEDDPRGAIEKWDDEVKRVLAETQYPVRS